MPYHSLFSHIIWGTKERLPLILPEFEARLYKVMAAKAVRLGAKVYAVSGVEDHIHMAVSLPPTIAPFEFIRQVKGNSSHFVNNELNKPFKWQAEYGIVSFGRKNLDWVVQYILEQKDHHANGTWKPPLERIEE